MKHALAVACACFSTFPVFADDSPTPYKTAADRTPEYAGPERDDPEPQGLREVRIGYFGPSDVNHPDGGTIWAGTKLAIDEANREGGYRAIPFKLVPGWAENPWKGGASAVTRMVYSDHVCAILGSIDGTSTHIAEQVVAKARVPLLDPASTDATVNQASVPWMLSCLPGDPEIAAALVDALQKDAPAGTFALFSSTDHDSRALVTELQKTFARKNIGPKVHVEFSPGTPKMKSLGQQVTDGSVKAALVIAEARDSARLVKEIRAQRKDLPVFGGPSFGRRAFRDAAIEGVRYPVLVDETPAFQRFATEFAAAYGFAPDFAAASAYDAARILVAAIRRAGLNRAKILDALNARSPWNGVTGEIRWDASGRSRRGVSMAPP